MRELVRWALVQHVLLRNPEFGPGGTFFAYSLHTAEPTFAQLSVSDLAPIPHADGVLEFAAPPSIGAIQAGFATDRPLVVASARFPQGQDYRALLRVVDRNGRWQVVHEPFTTRLRKVVAQFTQIHIVNDGDFGENTANFKGWIMEGSTPAGSLYHRRHRVLMLLTRGLAKVTVGSDAPSGNFLPGPASFRVVRCPALRTPSRWAWTKPWKRASSSSTQCR